MEILIIIGIATILAFLLYGTGYTSFVILPYIMRKKGKTKTKKLRKTKKIIKPSKVRKK